MRLTKKKRAHIVQELLEKHIPNPQISLHFDSPFQALLAVLLSAQCTDARVNQVSPKLFVQAETPQAMMQLLPQEIEEIIRPCGLAPQKSKAIAALSKILVEHYAGAVPKTMEALTDLPGVGRKTASVLLSQVFHQPAFPVDTHILRSAQRWGLSQGTTPHAVEKDLCALYPPVTWNRLHLQIILFARKFCPARGHDPSECPICSLLTPHTTNQKSPPKSK